MKILRIVLPTSLLILLIGCSKQEFPEQPAPPRPPVEELGKWLETLPGVQSVQEIETQEYKKHYMIVFKQLLDPQEPSAGTFLQRVFLSHQDFDHPVVFEANGYDAEWSMTKAPQTELTKRYQANRVEVEHRYSGKSIPSLRNWKYLTCENAAADLHAVRQALGTAYTGSWIATGVSKGGSNTMSYMMYHPTDIAAAVAYVGPICNGIEDSRFGTHLLNVGTPEMRQKIVNFQREVLIRRGKIQPLFFPTPAEPTDAKEYMTNDQAYEESVVFLAQTIWQYGWPIDDIPETDATDQQIIDYLSQFIPLNIENSSLSYLVDADRTRTSYLRRLKKHYTKAVGEPDPFVHYYIQALIEFGERAAFIEPLKDLIPDHESWSKNTIARFYVPADAADIQYSNKWNIQMNQWLQKDDPRLICVYGEYDIWTAAMPDKAYFAGKTNMAIFIQQAGSHSANITKLAPNDQQQAWDKLDSWVKK